MSIVRGPGEITLRMSLVDNTNWSSNPVTGQTAYCFIRRLSDDKWYRWSNGTWVTSSKPFSLTGFFAQEMDDKDDGSYEVEWDQGIADGGADREYTVHYIVDGGGFDQYRDQDHLVVDHRFDPDSIPFPFTVNDGANPLEGAVVNVRLSAGGRIIRKQTTDASGQALMSLSPGTYYAIATLNMYTHTEESVTVVAGGSKTLSMTAVTI